jgi:hypothetical protein
MKRLYFATVLPLLVVFLVSCTTGGKIELFNGADLDNWIIYTGDSGVEPEELFRAEDGMIQVSGISNGYIRTRESYSNYALHVEWRWTGEPVNSGVLIHVHGEDMIWPHAIECQLMHEHAGDVVLIGKGAGITVRDTTYLLESEENRFLVIPRMKESSEHPAGEWNSYDIRSHQGNLEVRVNGVLQNRGSEMTLTEGNIALQSEGAPMQFRNIYLVPL